MLVKFKFFTMVGHLLFLCSILSSQLYRESPQAVFWLRLKAVSEHLQFWISLARLFQMTVSVSGPQAQAPTVHMVSHPNYP